MGQIKHNWENKKDLLTQEKHVNYCYYLVPGVGIEPTQRQAPRDFKPLISHFFIFPLTSFYLLCFVNNLDIKNT